METGNFNSELNLPPPDSGSEKSASDKDKKKKKRKADLFKLDYLDGQFDKGTDKPAAEDEAEHAPAESFTSLLERLTNESKTDTKQEQKKQPELDDVLADKAVDEEADGSGDDPELAQLTPEERREAAEVYIDERQREIAEKLETTQPASEESDEERAVDEFLDGVRAKLRAKEAADVETAAAESFQEAAVKHAPDAAVQAVPAERTPGKGVSHDEVAGDQAMPLMSPDTLAPTPGVETIPMAEQAADESDVVHAMEYEDILPHEPTPPMGEAGGGAGGQNMPPDRPWDFPPLDGDHGRRGPELPHEPLTAEPLPVTRTGHEAGRASSEDDGRVPIGSVLVVGFAAYLFGRRRGRIRTERKLLPIQKNLERQVREVHEKLAFQETKLRKLVQEQAALRHVPERMPAAALAGAAPVTANRMAETQAPALRAVHAAPEANPSIISSSDPTPKTLERPVAVAAATQLFAREAERPADTPEQPPVSRQPEHPFTPPSTEAMPLPLRSDEVFAVPLMQPAPLYERRGPSSGTAPEVKRPSEVTPARTMSREELAKVADTIVVGEATVRQVFETNLISERGLRRVITEYQRGGDYRKVLAEELLIKETGYERDPRLRDQPIEGDSSRPGKGVAQLNPTTSGAPYVAPPPTAPPFPFPASVPAAAAPAATPPSPTRPQGVPPVQPTLIMANVVAVAVLILLLIVLFVLHL